jgi:hypothetical protein
MTLPDMVNEPALVPAIDLFGELLERRFKLGVYTSEDAVRYTFFVALIQALDLRPEDIVLEHDHGSIARAKIDAWVPSFGGRSYAIEFKYDRPIPSGRNAPLTQKAGHIIKDMFRLAKIDTAVGAEAVFVYLTTREMAGYFSNPNNGLADLFGLGTGSSLTIDNRYLLSRPETLRRSAGDVTPCILTCLCSRELCQAHKLRVFGVRRAL